jgi:ATP-dependent Lon protease
MQGMEEDIEFMPLITLEEENEPLKEKFGDQIPILPLRNTVLFPGVVIPITVGRDKSIKAVREAYAADRYIGVIAQQDANVEEPEFKDLYSVGTMAKILKMLKMPMAVQRPSSRESQVHHQGICSVDLSLKHLLMYWQIYPILMTSNLRHCVIIKRAAGNIIKLSPNIPTEANIMLRNIDSAGF